MLKTITGTDAAETVGGTPASDLGAGMRRGLRLMLGAVLVGHAVQLFSLLRLNTDAVRLLSMAWSAHTSGSYAVRGVVEQYPVGYPFMVRGLLAINLGNAFGLYLLNFLWLAVAAVGWFWMARRQFRLPEGWALAATLVPLVSWVLIKHAALPLSDIPYLGLSTLALVGLQDFWQSSGRGAWSSWAAAMLLAFGALQVRTIGMALVGAGLITLAFRLRARRRFARIQPEAPGSGWRGILAAIGGLIVLGLVLRTTTWYQTQFVQPGSYFVLMRTKLTEGSLSGWFETVGYRLREIFELTLNLPVWPENPAAYLPVAGIAVAGVVWAAIRCRESHQPLVIYTVLNALILLFWPCADPRFFLPLIPVASLLIASAALATPSDSPWRRIAGIVFLGYYTLAGCAALGHSIRQTLAGRELARNYSHGMVQSTYRQAFGFAPPAAGDALDAGVLATLRHYETRIKSPPSSR